MGKISLTGLTARDKAIKGMSYVASAVRSTIGTFGLNFLLEKQNKVTNDGYNISAELCPTIQDEFERRGALLAQEASSKTNEAVGDATSTAWALTEAIVKEAIRYLPNDKSIKAKKTPSEVIEMIKKAKNEVLEEMSKQVTPIKSQEELIKSALVSVENEEIAEILGKTQWELGEEGIIIAEEVNETKSEIEKVRGIRVDNGFGTSYVVTNPEKESLELNEISILMTNYTMDAKDIIDLKNPIFNPLITEKKTAIVLMARAFTSEAIKICMESMKTGFSIFPVNAPYTNQNEVMHDIEAVIGGRYIDTEESSLSDIHISDIGFAKRFVAKRFEAIITGVDNERAEIRVRERVEKLKKKIIGEKSEFSKKELETRIAQLTNGFAILKVGSQSLANRKRLKDKCDDAVNAVRLALKGGTVKGAGICFKEISEKLPEDNILKRPLTCIYDQIIGSAPEGWVVEEWVRDPYLVLKSALENACDVAGVFASINGQVVEENRPKCKCEEK